MKLRRSPAALAATLLIIDSLYHPYQGAVRQQVATAIRPTECEHARRVMPGIVAEAMSLPRMRSTVDKWLTKIADLSAMTVTGNERLQLTVICSNALTLLMSQFNSAVDGTRRENLQAARQEIVVLIEILNRTKTVHFQSADLQRLARVLTRAAADLELHSLVLEVVQAETRSRLDQCKASGL